MPARTEAGVAYIRFKGDFSEVNRQLAELGKGYRGVNRASEQSAKQTQRDERVRQKALADTLKHQNLLAASFGRAGREQKSLTERYRDQIKALGAANASYKEAAQHMGVTTREAKALADANRRLSISTQDVDRHTVRFGNSLDRNNRHLFSANAKFSLLQKTISLIKFPALITGVGLAAQALGSLGAGAVGLVGALAPLTGLVAAAPALYGALGQAAGVVALSGIKDLTQAMAGNQQALKRLTPAARRFMGQLKEMKPQFDSLKRAVQRPLFAGLNRGLHSAVRNFGVLKDVLHGTAQVLGDFAEQAGKLLGSKGFGRDFRRIGEGNNRLLRNFGKAALLVVKALTNVLVVAQPLVRFIGKLAVRFGEWANAASEAGRKSGRMNTFFHQTIQITKQLIRIMVNLGTGLINMGKAGADLGHTLIDSFEAATEKFKEFTQSAEGQNKMRAYFESAKGPLLEFFRLIRDVGGALLQLSGPQAGLTPLLKQIRTELLPSLTAVIQSTTQAFGPAFVSLLTHLADLFGLFKGSSQPLVLWAKAMDGLVQSINFLLENVPGLKFLLSWFIGIAAVAKTLQFAGMISGARVLLPLLKTMATRLGLINAAATTSAFAPGFVAGGVGGRGAAARGRGAAAPGVFAPGHGGAHSPHLPGPLGHAGAALTTAGIAEGLQGPERSRILSKFMKGFPGLGKLAANSFFRGFLDAVPELAASFALFDLLDKALSKDWKGLGESGAGALVGGLIGALAGPEGALLGAALGEAFGPGLIKGIQQNLVGDVGGTLKQVAIGAIAGPLGISASVAAKTVGINFSDGLKDVPIIGGLFGGGGGGDEAEKMAKPFKQFSTIIAGVLNRGKKPFDVYGNHIANLAIKTAKSLDPIREHANQVGKGFQAALVPLPQRVGSVFARIVSMWKGRMGDLGIITDRQMAKITAAMQRGPEQGRAAMVAVFGKIVDSVRAKMTAMGGVTEAGVQKINRIFALEAKLLGLKPGPGVTRAASPTGGKRGGGGPEGLRPGGAGAQHGAAIVPGIGSGDRHTLHLDGVPIAMVESGEQISVLNRTATARMMEFNSRVPRRQGGGYVTATGNRLGNLRWAGVAPDDYTDNVSAGALNIETQAALMALRALKQRTGAATVRSLFNEAMRMNALHQPYLWGGGHGGFSRNGPWDCSGAVSQVIHGAGFPLAAPMVSGGFTTYGLPGLGQQGKTGIWANSGHVWMTIDGQGFSTSHENPGDGWGTVSYTSRPGFVKRHPDLAAKMSGTGKNSRRGQPLQKGAMHGGVIRGFRSGGLVGYKQGGQKLKAGGGVRLSNFLKHGSHWLHPHNPMSANEGHTLLWQAGMPDSAAGRLTTVLPDESSGNWHAINPKSKASGVWQILGLPSGAPRGSLFDPVVNSIDAKLKWEQAGHSFSPWPTYPGSGPEGRILQNTVGKAATATGKAGKGAKTPKTVPFNVDDLPLKDQAKKELKEALSPAKQANLSSLADVYADYASRAADLGELVAGKNEIDWLNEQVAQLLKLRNKLVTAYLILVRAIERLNEQIKQMKTGPAKRKTKQIRNAANTQLGTIGSSLADIQGNVVNINPYQLVGNIKDVPDTTFGGKIGEVVSAIKSAGGEVNAADDTKTQLELEEAVKLIQQLRVSALTSPVLRAIPQMIDQVSGVPFAGSFAMGGVVPGPTGQAQVAVVHGGETITPAGADANVQVVIHGDVVPFEDRVGPAVEVYVNKKLRRDASLARRRSG